MDTERNLLFGVLAFQSGALEADGLAETCADWASAGNTRPIADLLVRRELMTVEQRIELEKVLEHELGTHGGDVQATLAATLDGRARHVLDGVARADGQFQAKLDGSLPRERAQKAPSPGGHELLEALGRGDTKPPTKISNSDGNTNGSASGQAEASGRQRDSGGGPSDDQGRGRANRSRTVDGESDHPPRYARSHLHAKGGMGQVWLAKDVSLGREIALKELRSDQTENPVVFSRFVYEAKITAQLEHPGIIPVYELGEGGPGKTPYYTMRFVKGRTLGEAIRAYHKRRAVGAADPLALHELLNAFVGVCNAMAYAHAKGIIHRDLKGQNIILGDFGEVIVLDWGLAKKIGKAASSAEPGSNPAESPGADEFARTQAFSQAPAAAGANHRDEPTLAADGQTRSGSTSAGGPETVAQTSPGSDVGSISADTVAAPDDATVAASFGSGAEFPPPSVSLSNAGTIETLAIGSDVNASPESGAGYEGTIQGQLLGTPAYMAPEQAEGRHDLANERTDVYGLGAILFEILTGKPPFTGSKSAEVIRKVLAEQATPPRRINPGAPPALEAVCLKAISKAREDRYASAGELAREVQRYLADEPVLAYPEPWKARALRWARRHKTMVAAAAGLLVAATAATSVGSVLIGQERNEAQAQRQQARLAVDDMYTDVAESWLEDRLDPLQQKFLEKSLAYYERFTSEDAKDPEVRLEHGRAYQRLGDIHRKLGRAQESQKAYRAALTECDALVAADAKAVPPRRLAGHVRARLGDLLVRHGGEAEAETLYARAIEAQKPLASAPNAKAEDRWLLARTLKSQADLIRLQGKFTRAEPVYGEAIAGFEKALALEPKNTEVRNDLAVAHDTLGLLLRELGQGDKAERSHRQAIDQLEPLVAECPTIPRFREALAKACNSLALLEIDAGRSAEAQPRLERERSLMERLVEDFPERPELRRALARSSINLGKLLLDDNRVDLAEAPLRKAIALEDPLAKEFPDDVQIALDRAKAHHNLGQFLVMTGRSKDAVASFRQARDVNQALAAKFPKIPRYRQFLAGNLLSLGTALADADGPSAESEAALRDAAAKYQALVAEAPDNVDYRMEFVRCLNSLGNVLTEAKRPDQAEAIFNQALAALAPTPARNRPIQAQGNVQGQGQAQGGPDSATGRRREAEILSNLGVLRREFKRPKAEEAFRRSIALSQGLVAQSQPAVQPGTKAADLPDPDRAKARKQVGRDIQNLAIAQNNLAELFVDQGRPQDAVKLFEDSVGNLETVIAETPKVIDPRLQLGYVSEQQGKLLAKLGKPAEAKLALERGAAQGREGVKLSKRANPAIREALRERLVALAEFNLESGALDEAAAAAREIPKVAPDSSRPVACVAAAEILAKCLAKATADPKLEPNRRDELTRKYFGPAVVLLRDAIDSQPDLAGRIKSEPAFEALRSRPEFQTLLGGLVDLAPASPRGE